jgi:hypothetical protein
MRLRSIALSAALFMGSAPLFASPVTFFGQDINTSGDPNTATPTNSNAAHNAFFSNLSGVETQPFESYATGTTLPQTISFGPAGNATLTDPTNSSFIESGNDGAGRFPISGSKYLETGAGSGFTITFSQPISAFGFYGTDVGDFGGILSLALSGITPEVLTIPATTGANGSTSGSVLYFGFYDTTDTFTSITFNNSGSGGVDIFGFDDFTIGVPSEVTPITPGVTPEPASLMLLGTGMTALLGLRKKLRN